MLQPDAGDAAGATIEPPILSVEHLTKDFPMRGGLFAGRRRARAVSAVAGVSLEVRRGETVGIVGESGCGKSTLSRLIVGLLEPTTGVIRFEGKPITSIRAGARRALAKRIQMVFQDPFSSLNPKMKVRDLVGEPLRIHGEYRQERVVELLRMVGLDAGDLDRRPREFSGGQRQRIGIARSIALKPSLLILDEPVSALDVSIQAQVVSLLQYLQSELGMSYIFVAHDLAVVRQIAHRVAVMYMGKIVEMGTSTDVYGQPQHPYTQALLSAVPEIAPRSQRRQRIILHGDIPSPASPPSGCRFRTRCWRAQDVCASREPELRSTEPDHIVACHFAGQDQSHSAGDRK